MVHSFPTRRSSELLERVKREVTQLLARVRIRSEEEVGQLEAADRRRLAAQAGNMQFQHPDMAGYGADQDVGAASAANVDATAFGAGAASAAIRNAPKVGRNEPCPCGSGKKFKQCHGQLS